MSPNRRPILVAVDIGNSSIKLAAIAIQGGSPEVVAVWSSMPSESVADFASRVSASSPANDILALPWAVSSVDQESRAELWSVYQGHVSEVRWHEIDSQDFPFPIRVDFPQRTGIDRLMSSLAAHHRSEPNRGAIVVDAGTAITVDLTDLDGSFLGGAIAPGVRTQLAALATNTSKLPRLELDLTAGPSAIGKNTEAAIQSGVYWGTVGMVQELVQRISEEAATAKIFHPELFLTGGLSALIQPHLKMPFRCEPHLVFEGIYYVAVHRMWTST